jgi:hypothetical protein
MIPIIDPDCTGRGPLREVQLMGLVRKLKEKGTLNQPAPACEGRGIVIAGGGRYLSHAWAVCRHLRKLGWTEGIQVWHLGKTEMPDSARPRFAPLDVELVDALEMRRSRPSRTLGGWELKIYAVMNCPWRHVLFLDADCIPAVHPNEIFNDKDVLRAGSLFFSDIGAQNKTSWGYTYCGIRRNKFEWEAGQFVVDKVRLWMGLRWTFWLQEHSDVWFKLGYGDKFTTELGVRMSGCPHLVSEKATWEGWGIGQWWKDRMVFMHQMAAKRGEHPWSPEFADALAEWHEPTLNTVPV